MSQENENEHTKLRPYTQLNSNGLVSKEYRIRKYNSIGNYHHSDKAWNEHKENGTCSACQYLCASLDLRRRPARMMTSQAPTCTHPPSRFPSSGEKIPEAWPVGRREREIKIRACISQKPDINLIKNIYTRKLIHFPI